MCSQVAPDDRAVLLLHRVSPFLSLSLSLSLSPSPLGSYIMERVMVCRPTEIHTFLLVLASFLPFSSFEQESVER